jgi:BASS family bile acid:Na+ symporter
VNIIDNILLPGSLWFIMFSMGLSLTIDDFRRIASNRRALIVGAGSMLLIPPIIGVLIATLFAPTPALAVGFVLLATCPGGMLSNLMTDLSKGDLALSLSLSVGVSAIYIFVVPVYAYLALHYFMGFSGAVEVPLGAFVWKVFSITLVPVTLGLAVNQLRPAVAAFLRGKLKLLATTVLVVAFVIILIDQVEVLKTNFWTLFWMTLGANLIVLAIAFSLTRATRLNPRETSAVCIEHMIRQEGTAIYIAVAVVGSREMSLPMIMNTPVALVLCILLVLAMRKYVNRYIAKENAA